jgi:hypothetical protein
VLSAGYKSVAAPYKDAFFTAHIENATYGREGLQGRICKPITPISCLYGHFKQRPRRKQFLFEFLK